MDSDAPAHENSFEIEMEWINLGGLMAAWVWLASSKPFNFQDQRTQPADNVSFFGRGVWGETFFFPKKSFPPQLLPEGSFEIEMDWLASSRLFIFKTMERNQRIM